MQLKKPFRRHSMARSASVSFDHMLEQSWNWSTGNAPSKESHCRQYTVGITAYDVSSCDENDLQQKLEQCSVLKMKMARYWLSMIGSFVPRSPHCPTQLFDLRLYNKENSNQTLQDMVEGRLDIYGVNRAIDEHSYETLAVVTPLISQDYYFYVNEDKITVLNSSGFGQASFLIAPFSGLVWAGVLLLSTMAAFTALLILKCARFPWIGWRMKLYESTLLIPLLTFAVLYNCALKATVIKPSVEQSFRSVDELTTKLESGQLQLLMEETVSTRRNMLGQEGFIDQDNVRRLVRLIARRPEVFKIVADMEHVCDLMRQSSRYVFFGYDSLIFTSCSDMCLWQFHLKEKPTTMSTYLLTKNSDLFTLASLAAHAVPSYRDAVVRRRRKVDCRRKNRFVYVINMNALLYSFVLICCGWTVGVSIFIFELIRSRVRALETSDYDNEPET